MHFPFFHSAICILLSADRFNKLFDGRHMLPWTLMMIVNGELQQQRHEKHLHVQCASMNFSSLFLHWPVTSSPEYQMLDWFLREENQVEKFSVFRCGESEKSTSIMHSCVEFLFEISMTERKSLKEGKLFGVYSEEVLPPCLFSEASQHDKRVFLSFQPASLPFFKSAFALKLSKHSPIDSIELFHHVGPKPSVIIHSRGANTGFIAHLRKIFTLSSHLLFQDFFTLLPPTEVEAPKLLGNSFSKSRYVPS